MAKKRAPGWAWYECKQLRKLKKGIKVMEREFFNAQLDSPATRLTMAKALTEIAQSMKNVIQKKWDEQRNNERRDA